MSSLDLYPTIVNLAGGTIPTTKIIDGKDIMDKLIAGQDARPNGEATYIVRPQLGFQNGAIMSYPWKIVKTGGNGKWKLFNIVNDPGESNDVRKTESTAEVIIQKLLDQGIAWAKQFKNVKPAWYDNDGEDGPDGPTGHPHAALWNDGTLPAYDKLFESSDLTLGLGSIYKSNMSIYPNPTADFININFDDKINSLDLEILSITGQTLKKIKGNNENIPRIDTSDLPKGTYILRILADGKLSLEKIIKI